MTFRAKSDGAKPYAKYRDSEDHWHGAVPDHWLVVRLRHILKSTTMRNRPDLPLLSVVREKGVIMRDHDAEENHNVIPEDLSNYKVVDEGQFAMNKMKAWQGSYGVSTYHGIVSPAYFTFEVTGVNKEFLHVALRSQQYVRFFGRASDGVRIGQWDLSPSRMKDIPLLVPPPDEQAAIVQYLDDADQRIRAYVSAKERLIALLEEERQAVIHQAVTRGLDPNVKLKPSGVEWLGNVPEHWEIGRLKSVSEIRYGLGQPPRESATGLPLIRATNISRGHIVEKDLLRVDPADVPTGRDAFLREKEIIVVRSGAYTADSAIIPKKYSGSVTGYDMVVGVNKAIPEFIAAALLSKYLRDDQLIVASNRAAQPHLNAEELGSAVILLPPLAEQSSIVEHLNKANQDIDTVSTQARRQIELMEEYRTRLIADVVTGEIDVRDAAERLPSRGDDYDPTE